MLPFGAKGAYAELKATLWLIENGHFVFRNVSPHGPVDLVAIKGTEVLLIDVKTGSTARNGVRYVRHITKEQAALGVKTISVFDDGILMDSNPPVTLIASEAVPCAVCGEMFVKRKPAQINCSRACKGSSFRAKIRQAAVAGILLLGLLILGAPSGQAEPLRRPVVSFGDWGQPNPMFDFQPISGPYNAVQRHARRSRGTVIGGRPSGCPARYCGCSASLYLFGKIIPRLNLAANWLSFPRAAPAPRMAAARRGHVFVLVEHRGGNTWLVHDGNSGGRLTRLHERSIAGFTVVNPHG